MATDLIADLEKNLIQAADGLPQVTDKKMFGCYALWANENVFALVWKHGRIGLKLPKEESYETLMKLAGAEPWKAGPMQMAHWVLVPPTFHTKATELKKWTKLAHQQCAVLEKKTKKATTSKKKVPAKTIKAAKTKVK